MDTERVEQAVKKDIRLAQDVLVKAYPDNYQLWYLQAEVQLAIRSGELGKAITKTGLIVIEYRKLNEEAMARLWHSIGVRLLEVSLNND